MECGWGEVERLVAKGERSEAGAGSHIRMVKTSVRRLVVPGVGVVSLCFSILCACPTPVR